MRNQLSKIPFTFDQQDIPLAVSSESTDLDSAVKQAVKTCNKSGTVSEILKLELKTKIQLRRHEKGKDLDFEEEKSPQIEYKLTPEDLEKRRELRERNKLSARKHRLKKKEEKLLMEKKVKRLLEKKHILQRKAKELESVRNKVHALFRILSVGKAA